jgi:hypothetical protein
MSIVQKIERKVKRQILPVIPVKMKKLFAFGINTLALVPYSSLNANAREYGGSKSSKANLMKMFRLVKHRQMNWVFYQLLPVLAKISPDFTFTNQSIINVDLTEFLPFALLVFSLQTHQGRSVPVFASIITYPITKQKSQNIFIADTLRKFLILINRGHLERRIIPRFVFDRGFMGKYLVDEFTRLGLTFYLRVKQSIWHTLVGDNRRRDGQVSYHGQTLRLIRSSKKGQKQTRSRQPWYILTNDTTSNRNKITQIYYHRFECEEWFRDLKHIFQTKQTFIKLPQTLLTIIWFQILGTWLLFATRPPPIVVLFTINAHKRLSWFRQTWEMLRQELSASVVKLRFAT